jgi:putative redox protein
VSYRCALSIAKPMGKGLLFEGTVGPPDVRVVVDSGPGVTVANPVLLVLVAAGGCSAMDVIEILRKQRQRITAYEVVVTAERRDEHPRIFTRIELLHRVTGHGIRVAAVEEAIRLSDTKYCSVHAMLHGTVTMTSRHEIIAAP